MRPEEVKLQIKATALNEIRKIYNPKYKFPYSVSDSWYGKESSRSEQREEQIKSIIENLEKDLQKLKNKQK